MKRKLANLLLAVYLSVQLLLPWRGLSRDKFETRGNFTWNMYASDYTCQGGYRLTPPGGESRVVDYLRAFHRADAAGRLTHRDRLPHFHRFMCDQIGAAGDLGTLEGRVACSLNGGPLIELIEPRVDLCTAPNHGVRLR